MIDEDLRKLFIGEATRIEHEAVSGLLALVVIGLLRVKYGPLDLGGFATFVSEVVETERRLQLMRGFKALLSMQSKP